LDYQSGKNGIGWEEIPGRGAKPRAPDKRYAIQRLLFCFLQKSLSEKADPALYKSPGNAQKKANNLCLR
jgi:hypothetical protein